MSLPDRQLDKRHHSKHRIRPAKMAAVNPKPRNSVLNVTDVEVLISFHDALMICNWTTASTTHTAIALQHKSLHHHETGMLMPLKQKYCFITAASTTKQHHQTMFSLRIDTTLQQSSPTPGDQSAIRGCDAAHPDICVSGSAQRRATSTRRG